MALDRQAPKTRMVQLLDLAHSTFGNMGEDGKWVPGKLTGLEQKEERRHWCFHNLPYDCPAFMRVFRRINVQKPGKKATSVEDLGTTVELDYFTFGVRVYLKHTRQKTRGGSSKLSIIIEDSEGTEVLAQYEKES